MSTTTEPRPVRLEDYTAPAFLIDQVDLRFELTEGDCVVRSRLALRRNPTGPAGQTLQLDGQELELLAVRLDGAELSAHQYTTDADHLTIRTVPDRFTLEIDTRIQPHLNTALEGLYRSGEMLCTQCEAEGFRKITFYPDRPDVMARFSTTIVADRARYPVLLSNGNLVASGTDGAAHWVTWVDPYPKPSYLFALVAGDLVSREDRYRTGSGREVTLRIYVEAHNIEKCAHAMQSLKEAMAWDERVYGLEYDLDVYMVVAVDSFNMGAMENKGLNVFNSKYVLADPASATDVDYENIESVIAHEYFHNWTGNRVTCRDWFQLSLKEGLTVFRDQQFSADMRSRAVKRINDVRVLRSAQFKEDAGPMAHPVRPESYLEINNFYTVTVYNKGAEVVRMLHEMLGPETFRRGMDLYFERHDGEAVTTDDFVAAMESASGLDLTQFRRWYSQAGTPQISVDEEYDAGSGDYRLQLTQRCPPTPGQPQKLPFHIPVTVGLLDRAGRRLAPEGASTPDDAGSVVVHLREPSQTITLGRFPEKPVASVLRGFSAPVRLDFERPAEELALLLAEDRDPFNRWDAAQTLAQRVLLALVKDPAADDRIVETLVETLAEAYRRLLGDEGADPALVAEMLLLPAESYLADQMSTIDVEGIHRAREQLRQRLARRLEAPLERRLDQLRDNTPYVFDTGPAARRALKNVCLAYLVALEKPGPIALALAQFRDTDNMTDQIAALSLLAHRAGPPRQEALDAFEARWRHEPLVLDKWFAIQAAAPLPDTLAVVERLLEHPGFNEHNPNRIRALVGTFCQQNQLRFHDPSGAGYRFLGDRLRAIDSLNPQVAARLAGAFGRWRKFDAPRRALMQAELEGLLGTEGLSRDSYEIVSRTLA